VQEANRIKKTKELLVLNKYTFFFFISASNHMVSVLSSTHLPFSFRS